MHGWVWRIGSAAIAILLCALPAGAVAAGRMIQIVQNADAPAPLRANSPKQIRKAQIELRRLECLKGRIDGKLGDQTREAVKKFWASAKQPAVEVTITDELISDLAARGDLFCRPVRPFFAIGGRAGGNSTLPPFLAPGARPSPAPAPAAPPAAAQ
jgi:peptidoglycan hydrolase-like protein with peptidoglycan-binding domain